MSYMEEGELKAISADELKKPIGVKHMSFNAHEQLPNTEGRVWNSISSLEFGKFRREKAKFCVPVASKVEI